MAFFLVGLGVFLGVHSLSIVSHASRERVAARLGEGPFKIAYSAVSVAAFGLMVWGYGQARVHAPGLWVPPSWTRHVVWVLMVPALVLFVATYAPGKIKSTVKHPMITAVKTWALAHLIANGSLADLFLFGGFLAWAVADRVSLKRRPGAKSPAPAPWGIGDAVAIVVGLGIYAAFFLWLHEWLIGVPVR